MFTEFTDELYIEDYLKFFFRLNMFLFSINIPTFHFSFSQIFLQLLVPKKFPSSLLVPPLNYTHM